MYNWVYHSSDFQCPWTGVPVQLIWDPTEDGVIIAQISESIDEDDKLFTEEVIEATENWCDHFESVFVDTWDEANDFAEEYGCYFP